MSGFIEFDHVKKIYGTGEAAVHALDDCRSASMRVNLS